MERICLKCKTKFEALTKYRRYCFKCSNNSHPTVSNKDELKLRKSLKRLRKNAKLSQKELADFLRTTQVEISNLEMNKGKLSVGLVFDLLDVYNGNREEKLTLNDLYL